MHPPGERPFPGQESQEEATVTIPSRATPSVVTQPGLDDLTDGELVLRIRGRGDEWQAAFDELIRRHRTWVFQRCLFHLRNYHDAEDATQEIMVRVLRGLDRFEGRSGLRTWLYTVVDNRCRSFAWKRSRQMLTVHTAALIQLYEESQINSECPEPDLSGQVMDVLAMVPDGVREVLELRFFRDYSLQEVATHLDISLSAAKMRLYRALKNFREKYSEVVVVTENS